MGVYMRGRDWIGRLVGRGRRGGSVQRAATRALGLSRDLDLANLINRDDRGVRWGALMVIMVESSDDF